MAPFESELQLRDEHDITILYISHDLATAKCLTERVGVMYLGRIVGVGATETVLGDQRHPYTQALVSVILVPDARPRRKRMILVGEMPNPNDQPFGCHSHARCPEASDECPQTKAHLRSGDPDHQANCVRV